MVNQRIVLAAVKVLRNPKNSKTAKTAAGFGLTQSLNRPTPKKK